jgi:unsaturated rhamnogalacturonyl hydrolase
MPQFDPPIPQRFLPRGLMPKLTFVSLALAGCGGLLGTTDNSGSGGAVAGGTGGATSGQGGAAGAAASGMGGATAGMDAGASSDCDGSHGAIVPGNVGVTAADFMMARWPELDYTAADCTGPSNCFSLNFPTVPAGPSPKFWEYTYGVPLVGIQKLYEKTGQAKYLAFVKKYVDRYVDANGVVSYGRPWPLNTDGTMLAPNDPTIQDVIQPSNLLFGMYAATNDARYLKAMSNTRQNFHNIMKNPGGAFWHKPSYPNQQWLDGIYMSEPFITRYGALHADSQLAGDSADCFSTATTQIKILASHTFDPQTKLYFHAWNGATDGVWLGLGLPSKTPVPTGTVVSPILWARSIAWFLAGTVDVLEYLPANHPDRQALLDVVSNIAQGLKAYQDPATGLWYQVVNQMDAPPPTNGGYAGETDKPGQPNWLETSSSGIFSYALAKAVRLGFISSNYLDVAKKGWAGVKSRIDFGTDGSVNIRGTVVGMSVGGTYNAYTNADFRTDLTTGAAPAPTTCKTAAQIAPGTTPTLDCRYTYVRDNVPQGFGAVLLAASELEF